MSDPIGGRRSDDIVRALEARYTPSVTGSGQTIPPTPSGGGGSSTGKWLTAAVVAIGVIIFAAIAFSATGRGVAGQTPPVVDVRGATEAAGAFITALYTGDEQRALASVDSTTPLGADFHVTMDVARFDWIAQGKPAIVGGWEAGLYRLSDPNGDRDVELTGTPVPGSAQVEVAVSSDGDGGMKLLLTNSGEVWKVGSVDGVPVSEYLADGSTGYADESVLRSLAAAYGQACSAGDKRTAYDLFSASYQAGMPMSSFPPSGQYDWEILDYQDLSSLGDTDVTVDVYEVNGSSASVDGRVVPAGYTPGVMDDQLRGFALKAMREGDSWRIDSVDWWRDGE